jgi:hypothetical protein
MPSSLVQGAAAHDVTIHTDADPTGGAVEFAFVAVGSGAAPSTFYAGAWGTWDSVTESVSARTPTIGAAGVAALAAGRYKVFARFTVGGETVVRPVAVEPLVVSAG